MVTLELNCWAYTSYNRETFYGVGTEIEALAYRDFLNQNRQSDLVEVEGQYKDPDYLDAVAIDLGSWLRDHQEKKLEKLKADILEGLESGIAQPLDIRDLIRLARYRKEAKELGLSDYRDLDLYALKTLVAETWATFSYSAEVYQDLEDYEKHLKANGVTGTMLTELLEQAAEDYEEEDN